MLFSIILTNCTENLKLMSVHLKAVGSWRENKIRLFAVCNHSKDQHGFGCQQFAKVMLAAIKRLKSLALLWIVREMRGREVGNPKNRGEKVITSTLLPIAFFQPPLPSGKTKGWDLIQVQIRFV